MEYVICGDTIAYKDCLVYTCGKSKELAEKALNRILNNPDKNDLEVLKKYTNLRVEEMPDSDCWWNYGTD